MCGIFAYINYITNKSLREILLRILSGLYKLEYRGYDSCGVCFDSISGSERRLVLAKTQGTVENLKQLLAGYINSNDMLQSHIAIGHTRWATHGPPTPVNAHPHFSSTNFEFVVCHNGIISNYAELKNRLLQEPQFSIADAPAPEDPVLIRQTDGTSVFVSETDTEVIAKLALFVFRKLSEQFGKKPTFLDVIVNTMKLTHGTYGAIFKSSLYPDECVACRLSSPLLIGLKYQGSNEAQHAARVIDLETGGQFVSVSGLDDATLRKAPKPCELYISSDATAFAEYTSDVIVLHDWDIVHITPGGVDIINTSPSGREPLLRVAENLEISLQSIAKGKYPHFMLKEIMEQPQSLQSTISGRLKPANSSIILGGIIPYIETIKQAKYITFIACGTSYNAALSVRPLFEQYTRQRILVEVASDFNDRKPVVFRDDVCVFISQSGETADTLMALERCRKAGAFCIGINNTPGSSLSRGTDCGIHLNAGAEIGVASTKCYSSSIVALILLLLLLIQDSVSLTETRKEAIKELQSLPKLIEEVLKLAPQMKEISSMISHQKNLIVIGRCTHYATARETALKVKELTYIHSEGLIAGELKHGPLALIDTNSLVIFFATGEDEEMFSACQSSLQQIKARGAKVMVVVNDQDAPKIDSSSDWQVVVPKTSQWIQMIVNIVPMQLLAYYTALERGNDVDRPRNLAKSVTVQ